MKKLVFASLICTLIAAPAFANDFTSAQAKTIGSIIKDMEKMTDNSAAMDFLTDKRNCVEKSTNLEGLQECIEKFQPQQLEAIVKG